MTTEDREGRGGAGCSDRGAWAVWRRDGLGEEKEPSKKGTRTPPPVPALPDRLGRVLLTLRPQSLGRLLSLSSQETTASGWPRVPAPFLKGQDKETQMGYSEVSKVDRRAQA